MEEDSCTGNYKYTCIRMGSAGGFERMGKLSKNLHKEEVIEKSDRKEGEAIGCVPRKRGNDDDD